MLSNNAFEELRKRDPRYAAEAYEFVMAALAYTVEQLDERRHVTGRELLFGIRDFALDCWGLMARHVLDSWGVRATEDFGKIVFNMIDAGLLSKTEQDSLVDFKDVYGFVEAFDQTRPPELDEHGHVRRKFPDVRADGPPAWLPFFGESGMN